MTDQTNPVVEAVADKIQSAFPLALREQCREAARAAILAHTQALMENVSEDVLEASGVEVQDWEPQERRLEYAKSDLCAMLTAHMEQMK